MGTLKTGEPQKDVKRMVRPFHPSPSLPIDLKTNEMLNLETQSLKMFYFCLIVNAIHCHIPRRSLGVWLREWKATTASFHSLCAHQECMGGLVK